MIGTDGGLVKPKANELLSLIYPQVVDLIDTSTASNQFQLKVVSGATVDGRLVMPLSEMAVEIDALDSSATEIECAVDAEDAGTHIDPDVGENYDMFTSGVNESSLPNEGVALDDDTGNSSLKDLVHSRLAIGIDRLASSLPLSDGSPAELVDSNAEFFKVHAARLGVADSDYSDFRIDLIGAISKRMDLAILPF